MIALPHIFFHLQSNNREMKTKVYLSPKPRSFEFTVDGFKGFFTRCIVPSASHIISYS